ncbi:DNA-binding domain-containing protein [Parabacteroides distasonis]|uniref:DNA-binding domain-containing protein n=1 Tax=Parabacteroides distasonis TaxID=823 RepID=UPI003F223599
MAEQIILNTDLYDNLLTERKGDYTAKPHITGTLYNTDIAARIVAARTEYQHGTILNILDMADSHKVQAIAEGKSVVDGVGQYLVNVQGAFEGEKAQFEPGKHALGITYTMGKLLRETLKLGGVNLKLQGDDPSIGVYLTPTTEGAAPMKAPVVIANSPSQVIVQMPTLADGQYTVSLTTQYSAGSRNIKEPRTYTFPILLTVGEGSGDSESPDEI